MFTKYIITNNVIEVYESDKYVAGKGGKRERKKLIDKLNNDFDRNYKNQCNVRFNEIRRLACSNFSRDSVFVTLTFDDKKVSHDIRNVKACNYEFKKFIQRLKYDYQQDFKYLAVIEFQDANERGAIHYHVLFNFPYFDINKLTELWSLGYVWINKIDHVDNVGAYLIKYITKDGGDKRLAGCKAYLHSNNLVKPVTIIDLGSDLKDKKFYSFNTLLANLEDIYSCEYDTDFLGHVKYKQYNLERGCSNE